MNARIVFMGTPNFSVPVLESLLKSTHHVVAVYTRPDRPAGRGRQSMPSPVKSAAIAAEIPVVEPPSLREETSAMELRSFDPDLVIVAAFAYLLPPQVLEVPRYGCLNVHPSLLPRHRGPSPVATALLRGDVETGVSIMLMDRGLDSGPILSQERVSIADEDTTGTLTMQLADLGAGLLLRTIDGWLEGSMSARPQNERDATSSERITARDGRLDWCLPAEALWRQVRAYHPWPGSYTLWHGQRLKVHNAQPLALQLQSAHPAGTVVEVSGPCAVGVVTADGVLGLRRIQLEGKREATAEEFVRGHRDFVGSLLDS